MRNLELEDLLNTPWAYTGSIAMKMHANRRGMPSRNAKNINVVVMDPKITSSFLASSGSWNYVNGPAIGKKVNHVRMRRKSNGKNLNVFRFGGRLANGTNKIRFINGVPVMSVRSLLNKKFVTLKNHPNNNKTKKNIEQLKKLLGGGNSPNNRKRRSPSRSPPIKNSFSTPSPKKRLVFF